MGWLVTLIAAGFFIWLLIKYHNFDWLSAS
jgi:hypothetical protein